MSDQAEQQPTDARPASRNGGDTVVVRYGCMGYLGQFRVPKGMELAEWNTKVVIQSGRGCEIGETINQTCDRGCAHQIPPEQLDLYVRNCGKEYCLPDAGRVIRVASAQDLDEHRRINEDSREKMRLCTEAAAQLGLSMKVTTCEHLLGGERIVFYFMSEGRVDFRQLVRELAHEYQTRIEMRQIGARDEARLVGDYEICGMQCCCRTFLKTLRPVSMKMAKMQKATLDPSKVSGRCGRLRCCLRYEQETYQDLSKRLPHNGTMWQSEAGVGRVIGKHILTQLVELAFEDGRRMAFPLEELTPADTGASPQEATPAARRPRRQDDRDQANDATETAGQGPTDGGGDVAADGKEAGPKEPPSRSQGGPRDGASATPRRRRRRGPRRRGGGPKPDQGGSGPDAGNSNGT